MIPFSNFSKWFVRHSSTSWTVYEKVDNQFQPIKTNVEESELNLDADFSLFKERPEYLVGSEVNLEPIDELQFKYNDLIAGALMIRAFLNGSDPDTASSQASAIINWLSQTDFYIAPASTQYHESHEHGLLLHSLKVYNAGLSLHNVNKFSAIPLHSITLCCLCHDWCKIGLYEKYMRNVKNEQTGKWEQQASYRHNQTGVPLGHGVSSMFLASRLIKLSIDEALAIRWHMGMFRCVDSEINELQLANENSPIVHLLQFADQLAIVRY